jgi:ABC-2 type transport system ATP-binding protein
MLVVDRVSRSFGSIVAVRDVSFTAEPGTVIGLLGPNGAGKTTTMRILLGIYVPDSGSVSWNGKPIGLATRRRFGYLPEERGLYGKMKVRDQIVYFGRLHGMEDDAARASAQTWMQTLEIDRYADRACNELSKGNQQKVQLASAVVHDPELLVLDEPFSGLDPVNAETMLSCIRNLAERGTTLVLSSHQMFQIEHACRSFCIIGEGHVRASGSLTELRRAFPTRAIRVGPDLPAFRALFAAHGAPEPRISGGELIYELPASIDFGALLREAVARGPLETFERQEPSLSQIYMRALEPLNAVQA